MVLMTRCFCCNEVSFSIMMKAEALLAWRPHFRFSHEHDDLNLVAAELNASACIPSSRI